MKILVTGTAGFIGFHITKKLLEEGHEVVGLDNLNDYYPVSLKLDRLKILGIPSKVNFQYGEAMQSSSYPIFTFCKLKVEDRKALPELFEREQFEVICHLAAQAGVRYSLENPEVYVDSNIVGFLNILECSRKFSIKHLVYASSSSVYGLNSKIPFSVLDPTDAPISLYAASKKSNELMAHTYNHLFGFGTTGLRFFTVYGPWGRPDMALYKFTKAIAEGNPIKVYNRGQLERDFTYIDDIVEGIFRVITTPNTGNDNKVYNIGNGSPVKLMEFIAAIEKSFGKKAIKEMMEMQPGDVTRTWADTTALKKDYGYQPTTSINKGIQQFVDWYKEYMGIDA